MCNHSMPKNWLWFGTRVFLQSRTTSRPRYHQFLSTRRYQSHEPVSQPSRRSFGSQLRAILWSALLLLKPLWQERRLALEHHSVMISVIVIFYQANTTHSLIFKCIYHEGNWKREVSFCHLFDFVTSQCLSMPCEAHNLVSLTCPGPTVTDPRRSKSSTYKKSTRN
jgi:hypothetical protein